jgi:hypothetical protein
MANPGAYSAIDQHDVPGQDGKASIGNFQWAAQGGLGAAGNATGGAGGMPGGAAGMPGGVGGMPGGVGAMPGGVGGMPGGVGGMPGGAGAMPGGTPPMTVQNAAGVIASYMGDKGIGAEDLNSLGQLATNQGAPANVQQAAQVLMANPGAYSAIDQHDVPGQDGKASIGNFQWAAQGGLGAAGNATGGASSMPAGAGMLPPTSGMPTPGTLPATGAMPATGTLRAMGGMPATTTTPPAKPGTGDLVNDGKKMQMADEGRAMADFNTYDATDFQAMESALSHGDGNSATKTLANAVTSGKLSQSDAAAIGSQLQQTANAHGGGRINDDASKTLSDALGGANVLTPGKTRTEIAFDNLTGIDTSSILGVSTK